MEGEAVCPSCRGRRTQEGSEAEGDPSGTTGAAQMPKSFSDEGSGSII